MNLTPSMLASREKAFKRAIAKRRELGPQQDRTKNANNQLTKEGGPHHKDQSRSAYTENTPPNQRKQGYIARKPPKTYAKPKQGAESLKTNKSAIKALNRSRSWYTKELDRVFSIFIRQRDANPQGIVKCFTCPKTAHWKEMHNSHYYSRRYMSLRWDEKNCHAACPKCNIFHEGNKPSYTIALIARYGQDILNQLQIKSNNTSKLGTFEFKYLIEDYKSKIKDENNPTTILT